MLKLPYDEIPTKILNHPTREEFNMLVKSAEPFKVIGVIEKWKLFKEISELKSIVDQCDYIASLAPNEQISFSILPPEQFGVFGLNQNLEQNFSFKSKKTSFYKFMDEVKKYVNKQMSGTLYLQSTPIKGLNNKLGNIPLFKGFKPMTKPRFWIGTGNQFVSLHNDPYRNIIGLFTGRKKIIMFPPEELYNIYPAPFDKKIGGVFSSLVNVFNPDLKKFPLFKKAVKKIKVAIINPGEFLYIPPLWWHAVEGESFNIGLNCWFFDDEYKVHNLSKLYLPYNFLMLDINNDSTPLFKKKQLYENFMRVINTNLETKSINRIDSEVIKNAKKISYIINSSKLSESQKKLWRNWIEVFAFYYIFCLEGNNPFPTLNEKEFTNMMKRLKNTKIKRILQNILDSIRIFLIKKIKDHGIVPS